MPAFNDIQVDTVTVGGTTLTVAQVAALLIAFFDQKAPAAFAAMAKAAQAAASAP